MSKLVSDLKYALRSLTRSPGFSGVAAATLALGIGANAAIFSVVDSVLLRPLPLPEADRIVAVSEAAADGRSMALCDPNYRDFRDQNRSLSAFAQYSVWPASVSGGTEPVRATRAVVSEGFFAALGIQPAIGRTFGAEERSPGGVPAVIVSDAYWKQYLSGETDLSRLSLRFDGELFRVVGVMPRGFGFPEDSQLWTAREHLPAEDSRSAHNWSGVGRLRDGVSLAAARSDLNAIGARIRSEHGDQVDLVGASVVPLKDRLVGGARPALWMLLSAVGFLMLVAAANVTNLSLARTSARRRELAVRSALGATRGDLFRAILAESFLVSLAGAAGGLLLCAWSLGAMRSLAGGILPRVGEVAIDWRVLAFAIFLCLAAALAIAAMSSGRSPEVRHRDLASGRSADAAGGSRAQGVLLGVQAAVTALLLAALALFARSFVSVLDVAPGFRTERILAIDLFPDDPGTESEKANRIAMLSRLQERMARIPGVERVGAVGGLPLATGLADGTFLLLGPNDPVPTVADFERLMRNPERTGQASYCAVTGSYFETMGIPLRRGRLFEERDVRDGSHVALISDSLARRRFGDRDPIGQRVEFGNMDGDLQPLTIVGVVGDVRQVSLESAPEDILYVNLAQRPQKTPMLTAVLRVSGDAAAVMSSARGVVRDIDPNLPPRFRLLEQVVSESVAGRRFSLTLLGLFGALALLLATAGVASVTAFNVARRRSEMGIRLALGAQPSDLMRLVLSRHLRIIALGGAAGLAAALVLARLLRSQLFGVAPSDPWSFAASLAILGTVGLIACAVPAARVARIAPNEALRAE